MPQHPLKAELESLRSHEAFRRLLAAVEKRVEAAKNDAILAEDDADVWRGRARGMMELYAWITPE